MLHKLFRFLELKHLHLIGIHEFVAICPKTEHSVGHNAMQQSTSLPLLVQPFKPTSFEM